jgi:hypothetical protein
MHPVAQYEGLDVKVWLSDSDGVDVMLAQLPDSTAVSDIKHSSGKKAVQVLTEAEYNSVATPYFEAGVLNGEARDAERSGDNDLAESKKAEAATKQAEALAALHAL